jgi:hypothetical protein
MRFWIKMLGIGVIGYLMFCLLPLPADYQALTQNSAELENLSSKLMVELSTTGLADVATLTRMREINEQRVVAFARWNDDLRRLGIS